MKDISTLPPDEQKHFMKCEYCKEYFDMRDLGDVFLHADGKCLEGVEKPKIPFSSSQRVGDAEEFFNDENKTKINLN